MYTYLASPYSSKAPTPEARHAERQDRFYRVMHALMWMLKQRMWAYSPIVHCHELAGRYELPTDAHFWMEYNHGMIRAAESVTILCLPGWRESVGVTDERQFATQIEKPLYFLHASYYGDPRVGVEIDYDHSTHEPKE